MTKIPNLRKNWRDYHRFMAELILKNNHDLVIETAGAWGESYTFKYLKREGWKGKYVTINPVGSNPKLNDSKIRSQEYDSPIWIRGDGIDNELINEILTITNPKNPVYIVNMAIGVMVTYESDKWTGKDIRKINGYSKRYEVSKKMAEIWAKNISKTRLETCYLTEYVKEIDMKRVKERVEKIESEGEKANIDILKGKPADLDDITLEFYNEFKDIWKKRRWKLTDKEFVDRKMKKRLLILTR